MIKLPDDPDEDPGSTSANVQSTASKNYPSILGSDPV